MTVRPNTDPSAVKTAARSLLIAWYLRSHTKVSLSGMQETPAHSADKYVRRAPNLDASYHKPTKSKTFFVAQRLFLTIFCGFSALPRLTKPQLRQSGEPAIWWQLDDHDSLGRASSKSNGQQPCMRVAGTSIGHGHLRFSLIGRRSLHDFPANSHAHFQIAIRMRRLGIAPFGHELNDADDPCRRAASSHRPCPKPG
jgi:hypothetical protein